LRKKHKELLTIAMHELLKETFFVAIDGEKNLIKT